jgi:hypothetical protein
MEIKIWEVVDGKLASVNVAEPERRINVIIKLREPIEIDQMESILPTIENFYGFASEVRTLRPPRKERKPKARRIAIELEDFEKEIKEKFGSQEFRSKEAIQYYIDKGETESLALKRKMWNYLRQLNSLGRLNKVRTGVWQFAE